MTGSFETENKFLTTTSLLKNWYGVLRHVAKVGLKNLLTQKILSFYLALVSLSAEYALIEKYEYSDAFEKERSGEEVRTGGGWRMNARGGGHASPPPLSSPPHPASEGLEAHYSTQLGNSRFRDIPIFQGVGRCHWGVHICLRILGDKKAIVHQEVLIF